jgi:D-3-phosphoglycerate dehydrogenase
MKILVAERISDNGMEYLKNNADVDIKLGVSREELKEIMPLYDALIVRSTVFVDGDLLSNASNLKVVGRAGNGVDNIDIPEATKRGIIVVNTPDSNSMSAAEHTIGLLLSCSRNIPQANSMVRSGDFRRNNLKGVELYNKTIGIIGLGRIGSIVASRLKAFQMRVVAYDPYISDDKFKKLGVERMESLDDMLPQCDFLTIHTPKTPETLGMISHEQFKKMKRTARVVNCARGGIINEEALKQALDEKIIESAAIDVLEVEPQYDLKPGETQDYENNLFELDRLIITPHIGASTKEAQDNVGIAVAKEVIEALKGDVVENAVNLPNLHSGELETLKPYMLLLEKMGSMYFQLYKNHIDRIEITYSGQIADCKIRMLTLSYLRGVLSNISDNNINFVNSYYTAREFGIDVVEGTSSQCENYTSLVKTKVYSGDTVYTFSGTVFGTHDVRITEVSGYLIDIIPEKYLLLINNTDTPGYVGRIGTILGNADINIATMKVSRNLRGDIALMAISVDDVIPEDIMDSIRRINGIAQANLIEF